MNLTQKSGGGFDTAAESLIMLPNSLRMNDYNFTPTLPPPTSRRKRDTEYVVASKEVEGKIDGKKRKIVTMVMN